MNWLVAIPAWGQRCLDIFEKATLPAALAAAKYSNSQIRFLIHTDNPARLALSMKGCEVEFRPVPVAGRDPHHKLGHANREAIAKAAPGECLAFINADMPGSTEIFGAAEQRFNEGKRLIMMAGTRTIGGIPPAGARSADLLRWSVQHAHPAMTECIFGIGRSKMCSTVYFRRGEDVICHAWHQHPFALLMDRKVEFAGVTTDRDLQDNYKRDEIHLVTDANESSFAEVSPPERVFGLGPAPMNISTILAWATKHNASSPHHAWFFEHPIAICGDGGDIGDRAVVNSVLKEFRARA